LEVFLDVKFPPGVGWTVVIACWFVGRALVLFFSYDVVDSRLPWEDLVGIFDFVLLAEVLGEHVFELLKFKCVGDGVGSPVWSFGDRSEDFNCCLGGPYDRYIYEGNSAEPNKEIEGDTGIQTTE